MTSCTHVQWLRLHQSQNVFSIQYGDRLRSMSKLLREPLNQYPTTVFFFGTRSKTTAIRRIFPQVPVTNSRTYGLANISIDLKTVNDEHPLFIAEGSPSELPQRLSSITENKCHEITTQTVDWPKPNSLSPKRGHLVDMIYSRLFFLFTDVICIFADDYEGLPGVAEKLLSWIGLGSASTMLTTVRPRVLVVTSISASDFDAESLTFRSQILLPNFSDVFSAIDLFNLGPKPRPANTLVYGQLKQRLMEHINTTQESRIKARCLFSAIHISSFFEKALKCFVKVPEGTFDFVTESRDGNSITADIESHMKTFMDICIRQKLPPCLVAQFIAGTILLDSYPPGMHLFDPSLVFQILYQPYFLRAVIDFAHDQALDIDLISNDLENYLVEKFLHMTNTCRAASDIYTELLLPNSKFWAKLNTTRTCLFCLRRKPEHILPCDHSICDVCISIFGRPTKGLEYHFDLNVCLLCQAKFSFQARLLPPTCRARLISIDGGGSRGIIPLEYLDALQNELDLPYNFQEHFDFGIGTSGLIILALFAKYWTTKECLKFFQQFARRIFPPELGIKGSVLAKLRKVIRSYFADGQYDTNFLEHTLQEAFGAGPLFSTVTSRPSGTKVAVTATTISDATLCLFSNYNGTGSLSYKQLRGSSVADEVLLWEAARCTTAAPWYFKPKHLPYFGTFQDGGLKYNNPVRPGLREVQRIWKEGDCDLVLSIGTGFKEQVISPKAPRVRNLFQDGAIARLYRASMSSLSLDSKNNWNDHWNGLEEGTKGQHFRLDLPLKGQQPGLNDVDKIPNLQQQVHLHLGDLKALVRAIKAVSFFFELKEPLQREGSLYKCNGFILSRSPNSRSLLQSIASDYPYAQFVTENETSLGFLNLEDICQTCGRFQKGVTFFVRHPSDVTNIQLVYSRLFRRNISGFPHTMRWFENRQLLDAHFGRPDHFFSQKSKERCPCLSLRVIESITCIDGAKRANCAFEVRRSKRQRQ